MREQINDRAHTLAHERVLARQAGIRLDAAQMQRTLPPTAQNAALLYIRLAQVLKTRPLNLPFFAAKSLSATVVYTPEQIAAVQKIYDARQDVWTLVHQAAEKPQCVFLRNWAAGMNVPYPEYETLRTAVRLLRTESYLWARSGNYAEALADDGLCLHIAEQAGAEPTAISYLVGVGCEFLALNSFQDTLLLTGPNQEIDAQAEALLKSHLPHLSLRDGLSGEPALMAKEFARMHHSERFGFLCLVTTGMPGANHVATGKLAAATERTFTHNLIDAWEADYLHEMRRLILAAALPPAARQTVFAEATRDQHQEFPLDLTRTISNIILPIFAPLDERDRQRLTREKIVQAAAVVLATKTKTGTIPVTLPPGFTDSFTGKPLLYRREGDGGFVVYSAGPTGHFDGGTPGQTILGTEALFRYPSPLLPVPPEMRK